MAVAIERPVAVKKQKEGALVNTKAIEVGRRSLLQCIYDAWWVFRGTHDHYLSYSLPDGSFGYGVVVGRSYIRGTVTIVNEGDDGGRLVFPGRFITFDSVFA